MSVNLLLIECFVRDANRAVDTLEKVQNREDEASIKLYTINVHAMKSSLANIGNPELSHFAAQLEQAGINRNTDILKRKTPEFLNRLRQVISTLTPQETESQNSESVEYLREKLIIIKNACKIYDKKTAKNLINELRKKSWSAEVRDLLSQIAEYLLSGDYNEIRTIIDKFNAQ
jgi:HPt (histidine-containing phosphotransfer) domain-containing protein